MTGRGLRPIKDCCRVLSAGVPGLAPGVSSTGGLLAESAAMTGSRSEDCMELGRKVEIENRDQITKEEKGNCFSGEWDGS